MFNKRENKKHKHSTVRYLLSASVVILCGVLYWYLGIRKPVWPTPELVPDEELIKIGNDLWELDEHRARPEDIKLETSGPKLFSYVNPELVKKPSYFLLWNLFDNYNSDYGVTDPQNQHITGEIDKFLDHVVHSKVMSRTYAFLCKYGLASTDLSQFKADLRQYWFKSYTQSGGVLDSSGFEHVFLGQTNKNRFFGFHNWYHYYLDEQAGNIKIVKRIRTCKPNTITLKINWKGRQKPVMGFIYGVSPEFELSLFTLCFLTRRNRECKTELGGFPISNIQARNIKEHADLVVGTTFIKC